MEGSSSGIHLLKVGGSTVKFLPLLGSSTIFCHFLSFFFPCHCFIFFYIACSFIFRSCHVSNIFWEDWVRVCPPEREAGHTGWRALEEERSCRIMCGRFACVGRCRAGPGPKFRWRRGR